MMMMMMMIGRTEQRSRVFGSGKPRSVLVRAVQRLICARGSVEVVGGREVPI